MYSAFLALALCQLLAISAQPDQSERFFPFEATRENALRQQRVVERLQRQYIEEQARFNPTRFSRQQTPYQAEIVRNANLQLQNLQLEQQRQLIQQGQASQQLQQQQLQQLAVQQQQQQLAPQFQFQPQTAEQALAIQSQREEIQRQQAAVATANQQFQSQISQQQTASQTALQQQMQQAQVQEQAQLAQAVSSGQRGRGRSQPLELTLTRQVRQEPMTEVCLACICQASTSCNLTTQCISGGQYCGPFLISKPYWLDAGSPTLLGDNPSRPGAFEDCTADPVCSAQTVRTYMTKYAKDCNGDGKINCDDLGRIHLMGAYGCADPSVTQSPFFQRFQQCVNRASKFSGN